MYFSASSVFAFAILAISSSPRSLTLLPADRRAIARRQTVIELVDFCLHFGGKTNAVQFITALQPADDIADLADLAYAGGRIAVFDVNATLRLCALRGVIVVIRHIARAVFYEVIFRIIPGPDHVFPRCR